MNQKYIKPEIEVEIILNEDVICASSGESENGFGSPNATGVFDDLFK